MNVSLKVDETSVSEGCQRRKAMVECVSQEGSKEVRQSGISPFPSSTYSLGLIPFYPKLTTSLWCAFWASRFGHRQRSWVIAKWSAFLHEGNHIDDLIILEGERIFAITHKLLCIWSLGTMWQFIPLGTRFRVWTWMFKGLYAFDQGCLRDDKYDTWSFLIPFFRRGTNASCYASRTTCIAIKMKSSSSKIKPNSKLVNFWLRMKHYLVWIYFPNSILG